MSDTVNPTPLDPEGWRPTFFDDFDGWYIDTNAWPILFGGPSANGAYTWSPEAILLYGAGELIVRNQATPAGWIAGGVSQGWNGQMYGRYEVRAKVDPGWGTGSVIGLWPVEGTYPPEVDMLEAPTPDRQTAYSVVHWEDAEGYDAIVRNEPLDTTQWHVYALDWLPDRLTLYIDGREIWTQTWGIPKEPMTLNLTGYVGEEDDGWTWGPPNAGTPPTVDMHVDWVRIWTPEEFWPGVLPAADYGTPGAWGPAPETVSTGMRAIEGENYAASWNRGEWGSVPAIRSAPGQWPTEGAARLAYANFQEAQLDLRAAAGRDLEVLVLGAARGTLATGDGADRITWVAQRQEGAGNTATISTGAGADTVLVTAAGPSSLDQPFGWGSLWDANYDGHLTVATVVGGPGDDRLEAGGLVALHASGGAGADTLVGGDGADEFTFAPGDGVDRVEGFTPGQDSIRLAGVSAAQTLVTQEDAGTRIAYSGQGDSVFVAGVSLQAGDILYGNGEPPPLPDSTSPPPSPAPGPAPAPAPVPPGGATEGPDRIVGTSGDDTLSGLGGDDVLEGGAGSDLLDGGAGTDTAVFTAALGAYVAETRTDGGLTLRGPDGTDTLIGVERLQFADATVSLDGNALFDPLFYLRTNPDVLVAGMDPLVHYRAFGWQEGRDPSPWFDAGGYLAANPDVAAAAMDPLAHYRDAGWREGRDPSAGFDVERYLAVNPDVMAAGVEPLTHWLTAGRAEGRTAFPAIGRDVVDGFDRSFYLLANPDVAAAGMDPALHYGEFGWREGRSPSALFDARAYLAANPDVAAAGIDPLAHYMAFGWQEGRDPGPAFDTDAYLEANPDVAAAGINPLEHFLRFGAAEGRQAFGDGPWG